MDANAHKKHLMVKSYQGADLIEVLPFHACDATSSPKPEHVKCLLNLQVQRISARFAVYLTGKDELRVLLHVKLTWAGVIKGQETPHLLLFLCVRCELIHCKSVLSKTQLKRFFGALVSSGSFPSLQLALHHALSPALLGRGCLRSSALNFAKLRWGLGIFCVGFRTTSLPCLNHGAAPRSAEKPGLSREVLESNGILVADVNTFLWTVPKAAAPFRRSYW